MISDSKPCVNPVRDEDIFKDRLKLFAVLTWVFFMAYAAVSLPFSDTDEFMYARWSQLIVNGYHPVIDYFSPQMDLFLYIYAYWMKFVGFSFDKMRILPALLMLLSIFFASYHIRRVYLIPLWLIIFYFSALTIYFNQTVLIKHYGIANPFFLMSFVFLCIVTEKNYLNIKMRYLIVFLTGLTISIAANTRIVYFPMAIIYYIIIYLKFQRKNYNTSVYVIAFIIPSLVSMSEIWRVGFSDFIFFKYGIRNIFMYDKAIDQYVSQESIDLTYNTIFNMFLYHQQSLFTLLSIVGIVVAGFVLIKNKFSIVNEYDRVALLSGIVIISIILIYSITGKGKVGLIYFTNIMPITAYLVLYTYKIFKLFWKNVLRNLFIAVVAINFLLDPVSYFMTQWIRFEVWDYRNPVLVMLAHKYFNHKKYPPEYYLKKTQLDDVSSVLRTYKNFDSRFARYLFTIIKGESEYYLQTVDLMARQAEKYLKDSHIKVSNVFVLDSGALITFPLNINTEIKDNNTSIGIASIWGLVPNSLKIKKDDYKFYSHDEVYDKIINRHYDIIVVSGSLYPDGVIMIKNAMKNKYEVLATDKLAGMTLFVKKTGFNAQ
ncbi:MAG: hypothetical protein H7833_12515 [Magnetococcus sp. DMHC-1]